MNWGECHKKAGIVYLKKIKSILPISFLLSEGQIGALCQDYHYYYYFLFL